MGGYLLDRVCEFAMIKMSTTDFIVALKVRNFIVSGFLFILVYDTIIIVEF